MTDLTRPAQSDFITEMRKLHEAQMAAVRQWRETQAESDWQAVQDAIEEMAWFLRYNDQGRLQEWFASRRSQ